MCRPFSFDGNGWDYTSPGVLSKSCSVFVSFFCSLFSELNSPFQRGAAPNARCWCGAQWLFDIYTVSIASGRLTVQKASGARRASSIRWKAQAAPLSAESHCATVRCTYPIPGPRTRPSEELLEFPLRPGQDARPSPGRLETPCSHPVAAPIRSNRRSRGTV